MYFLLTVTFCDNLVKIGTVTFREILVKIGWPYHMALLFFQMFQPNLQIVWKALLFLCYLNQNSQIVYFLLTVAFCENLVKIGW